MVYLSVFRKSSFSYSFSLIPFTRETSMAPLTQLTYTASVPSSLPKCAFHD